MTRKLPRIDRAKLRTSSARRRTSKVAVADEARPHRAGARFSDFLAGLPDVALRRNCPDITLPLVPIPEKPWTDSRSVTPLNSAGIPVSKSVKKTSKFAKKQQIP